MCRSKNNSWIESIKVVEGGLVNLSYHIKRMEATRKHHFNSTKNLSFDIVKELASYCNNETYKCRVVYGEHIEDISISLYSLKPIHSLQVVYDDQIDYAYKWEDRTMINNLYAQKKDADDILIIKNGLITDSSYCNIALYDGQKWITPQLPLLNGTKRAALINNGDIIEQEISIHSLLEYEKITLFNAMIEPFEIIMKVSDIQM